MIIIHHRRNTLDLLKATDVNYGIEIDIRSEGSELIVHHDPFVKGVPIRELLLLFNHRFLILNVKEEGLEQPLLELMNEFSIESFFFLDQSFPFLIKTAKAGESRCAIRLSEFESIQTVYKLASLVQWVWVDYFTQIPLNYSQSLELRDLNFKLCLVSPELQGYNYEDVKRVKLDLSYQNIIFDAVCTKFPELWSDSIKPIC